MQAYCKVFVRLDVPQLRSSFLSQSIVSDITLLRSWTG